MLLAGFWLFPYPQPSFQWVAYVILFLGLGLLGAGVLDPSAKRGSILKAVGWVLFAFFWSTFPSFLYYSEGGDIVNAVVAVIGVYILVYLGYQEWLSTKLGEYPKSLAWIAGAASLAGLVYFSIDILLPSLKDGLIVVVAGQSAWLLTLFGQEVSQSGAIILLNNVPIQIIFACTAIQSIMLFVGMIGAMPSVDVRRRLVALLATVIPIYLLNLVRNAGVVFLVGGEVTSFEMAHNVIGKAGSLLALVALLFLTFRMVPELYDTLVGVFSLPKRKGPLERILWRTPA